MLRAEHHLRNTSGTGWCVAGTSDGLFTASWDYVKPGTPAKDPVYGPPYTGCGYGYAKLVSSNWQYYPVGSTTVIIGDAPLCPAGYYSSRLRMSAYGCDKDDSTTPCPIAGVHLSSSRCGRPYASVVTPGQPATPATYLNTGAQRVGSSAPVRT